MNHPSIRPLLALVGPTNEVRIYPGGASAVSVDVRCAGGPPGGPTRPDGEQARRSITLEVLKQPVDQVSGDSIGLPTILSRQVVTLRYHHFSWYGRARLHVSPEAAAKLYYRLSDFRVTAHDEE